jgi:small subunit ribosomal protein S8
LLNGRSPKSLKSGNIIDAKFAEGRGPISGISECAGFASGSMPRRDLFPVLSKAAGSQRERLFFMDVIANFLTKIRNSLVRRVERVEVAKSGIVGDILNVMKKEGYITDFKDSPDSKFKYLVFLKTYNGKPVITGLKRISKLSKRVYVNADNVPKVYNNLGISVISTSKGVLADKEARALKIGGEVICYIW